MGRTEEERGKTNNGELFLLADKGTGNIMTDENVIGIYRVGDFVAVATQNMNNESVHWTLGSVESTPFARDLEIRLWEKQRESFDEKHVAETEEGRKLIEHILKVRTELVKSTEEAAKLTENLRAQRARIVEKSGTADIHIAESNAAAVAARSDVEKISYRHWHELKSYRLPPKMITTILRAVMLLFSEDDARDWSHMQHIMRDKNFKQLILEYDPNIMLSDERREYILRECVSNKNFRYGCAVKSSQAMGPIYYWALAQLDRSEANTRKLDVEKEKDTCKDELQSVMKEIHEQQRRMGEYQSMMDKLDDQLNAYRMKELERHNSQGLLNKPYETAGERYERSFAKSEGKDYLLAAYYVWKPTDRIILVLRRNILANYKTLDDSAWKEGYLLQDGQIRALDNALIACQRDMDDLRNNEEERLRRQQNEQKEIEEGLFQTTRGQDEQYSSVDNICRCFNGSNWEDVLARKRLAVLDTFCEETAERLQIPQYNVYVLSLSATEADEGLRTVAQVRHDGTKSMDIIQSIVDQYPYPRLHSLYDSEKPHVEDKKPFLPVERQMFFKGNSWKSILQKNEGAVSQAFVNDTSKALGVANKTDICVIATKYDDGLEILYNLQQPTSVDDTIEDIVNMYEYPQLWALYNNNRTPRYCTKTFDGDNWKDVQEAQPDALVEAFRADTADALGVPEENVIVQSMSAMEDALAVRCAVRDNERTGAEIESALRECPYPEVWKLYDEATVKQEVYVQTPQHVGFEGVDWDYVLSVKKDMVHRAFVKSTAAPFELTEEHVNNVAMRYKDEGLRVDFELSHPVSMTEKYIKNQLKMCDYTAVWALYEARPYNPAEKVETTHKLDFEGEDWGYVVEQRRPDVEEAVAVGTAKALQVNQEDVQKVDLDVTPESLIASVRVSHTPLLSEAQIKDELIAYPYDELWKLYEVRPTEVAKNGAAGMSASNRESSVLTRKFDGEDWDLVLDGSREKLLEAFKKDTADALVVSPSQVVVLDARIGSLIVDYKVLGSDMEDEEIIKHTGTYMYPEVHALYVPRVRGTGDGDDAVAKTRGMHRNMDAVPTEHTKTFAGDNWKDVQEALPDALEEAFRADTADALGVPEENVIVQSMSAMEDALAVRCAVRDNERTGAEIESALRECPYPEVWKLYDEATVKQEVYVQTPQHVAFEGVDWDYVLSVKKDMVHRAFVKSTAAPFELTEEHVNNVAMRYKDEGLRVDFELSHPVSMTEKYIKNQLKMCDYTAVWALYEARPYNPAEKVETTHKLDFEGEDWGYVVEQRRPDVEEAVAVGTAKALQVNQEDVQKVDLDVTPESLIASVRVSHTPLLSEAQIKDELIAYPYDKLWDLYKTRPTKMAKNHEPSVLTRTFAGDNWVDVQEALPDALEEAFRADTADALGVPEENVIVQSMSAMEDALAVRCAVRDNERTGAEIESALRECPYPEVWKLYDEATVKQEVYVQTPQHVGFEGVDWDYVLSVKKDMVHRAFVKSTAAPFELTEEHVNNVAMRYKDEGLRVDFELSHPVSMTEKYIKNQLKMCDYTAVWALYEARPYKPAEKVETTHKLDFEGEDWGYVVEQRRPDVEEAVAVGTAKALQVNQEDVQKVDLDVTPESLIASVRVSHTPLLSEAQIKDELIAYPYDELWKLYEVRPTEVAKNHEPSVLTRTFAGENWVDVQEALPDALEEAFRADTADALGVPEENVIVQSMSAMEDALAVRCAVRDNERTGAEIESALRECPYPEVWKLYDEATVKQEVYVQTPQHVAFEGVDWDYVLSVKKDMVHRAFVKSTAAPFELTEKHVNNVAMRYKDEGLRVDFELSHPVSMTEKYIKNQLKMCDYTAVWALYEARPYNPAEKVETTHKVGFEGEDWGYVVEQRRPDVEEAVAVGTAKALQVNQEDVQKVDLDVTPESLIASVRVSHTPLLSEAQIKDELIAYPYDELWKLYEVRPTEVAKNGAAGMSASNRESSVLTRKFDGEDWDLVLDGSREKLLEAFKKDTADALVVPPSQVVVLDARIGSLIVDYKVLGSDMEDEEIIKHTGTYMYPEVHALYVPRVRGTGDGDDAVAKTRGMHRNMDAVPTEHTKTFAGENWVDVQEALPDALEEAFRADTADALGVPEENVIVQSMSAMEDALAVRCAVRDNERTGAEIESALRECPYPEVWKRYDEATVKQEVYVQTPQHVGFEGVDWDYVLSVKKDMVHRAFVKSTAAPFELTEEHVNNVAMRYKDEGLRVDFELSHPVSITEKYIKNQLKMCDYTAVWALYEARPYNPAEKVETTHKVDFEGEDWGYVVEQRRPDVEEAVAVGTAKALQVNQEDVQKVDLDVTPESLIASVRVSHTPLLSEAQIKDELIAYPYDELWELYEVRPTEVVKNGAAGMSASNRDSAVLTRKFDGEIRDIVALESPAKLLEAFKKDTADALVVSPSQVVVLGARIGNLIVDYKVLGSDMDDEEIIKRTDTHNYPELHALYEPRGRGSCNGDCRVVVGKSDIVEMRGSLLRKCDISVVFDGEYWNYVLAKKRDEVCEAFVRGTAKAVGVDVGAVKILELATGSLMVKCSVNYPLSFDEQKVEERVTLYEYREVWDLYEPRPFDVDLDKMTISHHTVVFEAIDWDFTFAVKQFEVEVAFLTGTCLACGVKRQNIQNLSFDISHDAMTVAFDFIHPTSLTCEAVDASLARYPYAQVWALHSRPNPAAAGARTVTAPASESIRR